MRTSMDVPGITHGRTEPRSARRRRAVLAILLVVAAAAGPATACTSAPAPVSECSDFGCEK